MLTIPKVYSQANPVHNRERADSLLQKVEVIPGGLKEADEAIQANVQKITGVTKKADSAVTKYTGKVTGSIKTVTSTKDSIVARLEALPAKFFDKVDKKVGTYSDRISKKTLKTLTKLSKWESKIKSMLEKTSPETAQRLFGNNQLTFSLLLQKFKDGETVTKKYHAQYDAYRDRLTTSFKYLDSQKSNLDKKLLNPLAKTRQSVDSMTKTLINVEAVQQIIKERKKQLIEGAYQYLGKSKYLSNISKESWYYVETMKNYKELFNDLGKAEQMARSILNKIPAFQKFFKEHSQLSALFGTTGTGNQNSGASISGLQTRSTVQDLVIAQIGSRGINPEQMLAKNIDHAQSELAELKSKVLKAGGNGSDLTMPDFKPNTQKTKTLRQRIEYTTDIQFSKNNSLVPTTSDISLGIGYKVNDKSIIGIAASYKLGWGTISKIKITHQGIGLRSYVDWKLGKSLFLSGGLEANYNAQFKNIEVLKNSNDWQQSALVGITKRLPFKTKWFKATKIQLLYDFLSRQHTPVSQSFLFRIGYAF